MNHALEKTGSPVVGILGGGQLARMLALAGLPLGLRFVFLDPAKDACAASVGKHICGNFDSPEALAELARHATVITYETENIPRDALHQLSGRAVVYPGENALSVACDRLLEKNLFVTLGIPVTPYLPVNTREELEQAVVDLNPPCILKTRTLGYDGKGQVLLRKSDEVESAWKRLGGVPLILEKFIPFHREISIIAVRSQSGEIRFYPLSQNVHRNGILHYSRNLDGDKHQQTTESYARLLLEHLDYVGVMALELFDNGDGMMVNEMAPRVHNSGHWTIEGSLTSQFENHLRAITGLPLGSTQSKGQTAMVNFIGQLPKVSDVLSIPGASLHDYGKASQQGRKVGHATLFTGSDVLLQECLQHLLAISNETNAFLPP